MRAPLDNGVLLKVELPLVISLTIQAELLHKAVISVLEDITVQLKLLLCQSYAHEALIVYLDHNSQLNVQPVFIVTLVLHTLCHVLLVSSVLAALIHTTNVHLVPTVQ